MRTFGYLAGIQGENHTNLSKKVSEGKGEAQRVAWHPREQGWKRKKELGPI